MLLIEAMRIMVPSTNGPVAALPGVPVITKPIRATYRDTDKMGHVYYANYLVWFEIGRTELLRSIGTTYRQWEEVEGLFLPVRRCEVTYRTPVLYDEEITVETTVEAYSRASITFKYSVHKLSGELSATGLTQHPILNAEGRVVRRLHEVLPHWFKEPFRPEA